MDYQAWVRKGKSQSTLNCYPIFLQDMGEAKLDGVLRTPSLSPTLLGVQSQVPHSTVTCPGLQPEPPLPPVSLLLTATVVQTVIRFLHANENDATKEQPKHEFAAFLLIHGGSWSKDDSKQRHLKQAGDRAEICRWPPLTLPALLLVQHSLAPLLPNRSTLVQCDAARCQSACQPNR